MTSKAHSAVGASGAHRWMRCPGSVRLVDHLGLHGGISSEYAREGTAAHSLLERCYEGAEPWQFAGQTIDVEGQPFEVTNDMVDAVALAVANVEPYTIDRRIEHAISLANLGFPNAFGTLDFGARTEDGGVVIQDFKYGMGVEVEAEENPQIMYYALGYILALEEEGQFLEPHAPVRMMIVQPRIFGQKIKTWKITVKELFYWADNTLIPALEDVQNKPWQFEPGEHCRFCPALPHCQVAQAWIEPDPKALEGQNIGALTPERMAYYLERKSISSKFYREVEATAFGKAMNGVYVPGFKLVPAKSDRIWKDEAEQELSEKLGDDAYERKLLSPAQIEKLGSQGKVLVKGLAYKPDRGLTLVPESDKRAGVSRSNSEVFQHVIKEEV